MNSYRTGQASIQQKKQGKSKSMAAYGRDEEDVRYDGEEELKNDEGFKASDSDS